MATSNLAINISANVTSASRAIGILEGQFGSLGRAISSISQIASGMAVGQVLSNVVTEMTKNFQEAITTTENLGSAVRTLQGIAGGTAEETSALLEVFARYGVEASAAGNALGIFGRHLAGIEDLTDGVLVSSASFKTSMTALGVTFTDTAGKALPMQQVLLATAEKFQNLGPGVDRTAIAMQLFGRAGKDMIPILALGREGLQEAMDAAQRYGLTLSGENVNQIREFSAAHKNLDAALSGITLSIGKLAIPALAELAKAAAYDAEVFNEKAIPALNDFGAAVTTVSAHVVRDYNAIADARDRVSATNVGKAIGQAAPPAAVQSVVSTGVQAFTDRVGNMALGLTPAIKGAIALDQAIGLLQDRFGGTRASVQHFGDTMGAVMANTTEVSNATKKYDDTVHHLSDTLGNVVGVENELTQSFINNHNAALSATEATAALIKANNDALLASQSHPDRVVESLEGASSGLSRMAPENLRRIQEEQLKLAESSHKVGQGLGFIGQNALLALPGLAALDLAIAGTTQKIAGLELGIAQKALVRMERRGPPRNVGQELALLNMQLKVENLEKAAGFTVSQQSLKITNAQGVAAQHAAVVARAQSKAGGSIIHINGPVVHVAAVNSPADAKLVADHVLGAILGSGKTANTAPKTLPGAA